MATHSSVLAWRIPWTEGPGGLQSMGLQRVRPTKQLTHTLTLSQDSYENGNDPSHEKLLFKGYSTNISRI